MCSSDLGGDHSGKCNDIIPTDVTFVRARVNGYSLGTKPLAVHGHPQDIRIVAAPRIAQRGHLVDVYAQPGHFTGSSCFPKFVRIYTTANHHTKGSQTIPI